MRKDYNTNKRSHSIFDREKIIAAILLVAVLILIGFGIGSYCRGEEPLATCYAMCKPGSRVTVRRTPDPGGVETGYLECGDSFQTDAEVRDGWLRCYGAGENGWIYLGYVVTEPVQKIGEQYVCVAKKQVACRRWIAGPQLDGRSGWLKNGQNCDVFCMSDGWAVTSRGYIKSEWLEADPR